MRALRNDIRTMYRNGHRVEAAALYSALVFVGATIATAAVMTAPLVIVHPARALMGISLTAAWWIGFRVYVRE